MPADTAVTTPLLFIVATPVLLLLQVPPPVASARVVVAPTQRVTGVPGVIAAGLLFTVTVASASQLPIVYVIVAVPNVIPVTSPLPSTVATPILLLLHVPPLTLLLSVVLVPMHTDADDGEIVAGAVFTVTLLITVQPATV